MVGLTDSRGWRMEGDPWCQGGHTSTATQAKPCETSDFGRYHLSFYMPKLVAGSSAKYHNISHNIDPGPLFTIQSLERLMWRQRAYFKINLSQLKRKASRLQFFCWLLPVIHIHIIPLVGGLKWNHIKHFLFPPTFRDGWLVELHTFFHRGYRHRGGSTTQTRSPNQISSPQQEWQWPLRSAFLSSSWLSVCYALTKERRGCEPMGDPSLNLADLHIIRIGQTCGIYWYIIKQWWFWIIRIIRIRHPCYSMLW